MRPAEATATEELFEGLECIEATQKIACSAGMLKYEWARKGVTLEITDAIIAATTLSFDLYLATDNLRHFPMSELNHIDLPVT